MCVHYTNYMHVFLPTNLFVFFHFFNPSCGAYKLLNPSMFIDDLVYIYLSGKTLACTVICKFFAMTKYGEVFYVLPTFDCPSLSIKVKQGWRSLSSSPLFLHRRQPAPPAPLTPLAPSQGRQMGIFKPPHIRPQTAALEGLR